MANENNQEATIHVSAVVVDGRGVLIRGESGAGKSSLALALLFDGVGEGRLIADDRVHLAVEEGRLIASPPEAIAGLIEVRGVGILKLPYTTAAQIDLVADLAPLAACPRLPDETEAVVEIAGIRLPRIFVAIGAPDGVPRIRAALTRFGA